ncbi:hypothetical protein [Bacillus manliponensis]|uniref:hypothetical protein n=1 Tax=Bacillus manliponensis TaxID=574376 RepID=UPI000A74F6C7|nr:hypothetical protein [Bacillus manliponensis]
MNNVIDLENVRMKKHQNKLITVPVVERIYVENGTIKAEITGEREIPKTMIDKK